MADAVIDLDLLDEHETSRLERLFWSAVDEANLNDWHEYLGTRRERLSEFLRLQKEVESEARALPETQAVQPNGHMRALREGGDCNR